MGQEDPLEKEMATHSSILAWKIPWTEEPGGLQSMGSQRVRHDWVTRQQAALKKNKIKCNLNKCPEHKYRNAQFWSAAIFSHCVFLYELFLSTNLLCVK